MRQVECLAQNLVLEGFLAEQPLQFPDLVLQTPVFGGGHHFFAGPDRRQRSLGIEPTPSEHLVRRDPMLPRHQRHRHSRRVEPAPAKAGVSCTIRAFSSADQRRRRWTDVMTSTRSIFPVIDMCGRPEWSKKVRRVDCAWSGADMCTASDAATRMPRARMGFADRVQYTVACSKHLSMTWFSRPRLSTLRHTLRLTLPLPQRPRDHCLRSRDRS